MDIIEMPRFEALKDAVPTPFTDLNYANKVWLSGIKERMLAKDNAYSLFGCDFGSKPSFSSMPATMAFVKEPYDGDIKEIRVAGVPSLPGRDTVKFYPQQGIHSNDWKQRGQGGYNEA